MKWDTVIEQKTVELGRYLVGRTSRFDFSEPSPALGRTGEREVRRRILGLSQSKAQRLGIGKGTLHYLRKNVERGTSLNVYTKTLRRLELEKGAV